MGLAYVPLKMRKETNQQRHIFRRKAELIYKLYGLVEHAGIPLYLNKKGPKKYDIVQHLLVLLVRERCKLGYRESVRFLRELGFVVPTYSAVAKRAAKIPMVVLKRLLRATADLIRGMIGAIDGTGLSIVKGSEYYYMRIDGKKVNTFRKLSIGIDVNSKLILSLKIRKKPRHDAVDAIALMKEMLRYKPTHILADKGYDCRKIREFCHKHNIIAVIPMRNYGKHRVRRFYHKKAKAEFKQWKKLYQKRNAVETAISVLKRLFSDKIKSEKYKYMKTEIFIRAIAYNLRIISYIFVHLIPHNTASIFHNLLLKLYFQRDPKNQKL